MVHQPPSAEAPLVRGLRVLDRLGSTPQGALYQAEYPNGVAVALLVLRSDATGGEPLVEQFTTATRIQHPNVAAVYEVGKLEDGSAYAVLEQLVGEPLSDLLAVAEVLALGEALDLVLQVAAGLRAAYREGFVHGNLSPDTILVTRAPYGLPQVKLNGFSLRSDPQNRGGASAGYASPERLAGLPPDERSEVFSVAAVLHHLLTGTPPDAGRADGLVPRVARKLLRTALAEAPDRRYQTLAELNEALLSVAAEVANPKRPRGHRRRLMAAAAAGLVVVIGGIRLLPDSKPMATTAEPARVAAPAVSREPPRVPTDSTPDERPARAKRAMQKAPQKPRVRPPPVAETRRRQTEDTAPPSEPLGYMAEPRSASESTPPPPVTPPAREAGPARVPPPARTTADPRSRAELEQDPGLRQSIGDVIRVGVARNVAEASPGLLVVSLTPGAMEAPSVMYNLQRLYLAYSAATEYRDEVALELRRGSDLYGWFTREGLAEAN